jgi:hypothetical protein
MPRIKALSVLAAAFLLLIPSSVSSNDLCGDILRFGIFEKFESVDTRYLVTQAQRFYCNKTSSSNQSSTAFGLDVTTVVDSLPIEFGGYYRDRDESSWQQEVCQYDWNKLADFSTRRVSVEAASSTIANAWRHCMEAQQNGVVAGVAFSTPENFSLTVKLQGLPSIPSLSYNRIYPVKSGVAFSPPAAGRLIDPFGTVTKVSSREHVFRGVRLSPSAFDIHVASKPNAVRISVPSSAAPPEKPLPIFKGAYLADLPNRVIEGVYQPRNCYGSAVILTMEGSYPNSVVIPPGLTGRSAVEWAMKRDCFDSRNGYPASMFRIFVDGVLVKSGAIGGRHDLPESVVKFGPDGFTANVEGHRFLRLETDDHGQGRWCDHTTFLNPKFN